ERGLLLGCFLGHRLSRNSRSSSAQSRHITAPTYHGTNSLCPYPCFSLLVFSPEQVASISSNRRSPTRSTDVLPSAISPALRSMSSSCLIHSGVLVESFSDGEGAQPYAEPR